MAQDQNINNNQPTDSEPDTSIKFTRWLTIIAAVILVVVIIGGIIMYFTI